MKLFQVEDDAVLVMILESIFDTRPDLVEDVDFSGTSPFIHLPA